MTPRTAARIAIIGVSIGLVMSIADSDLQFWFMQKLGLGHRASAFFNRAYWILRSLLSQGSILLFLIVFSRHNRSNPSA